ncbi:MAG: glycosyltransferase family 4 protein [Microcoleaceae cyanobacterium]
MKAILVFNFDLEIILKEWQEEGHSAHHLWGKTELDKYGIDLEIFPYEKYGFLKKISNKIKFLGDLDQQIRILSSQNQYDVVYSAHQMTTALLGFLRRIGVFRKPLVVVIHRTFEKNLITQFFTNLFVLGNDKLLCLSEETLNDLREKFNVPKEKLALLNWCIDINYDSLKSNNIISESAQSQGYILTSGRTNRDYETLIKAFESIDYHLKILGFGSSLAVQSPTLPQNIILCKDQFIPTPKVLDEIKNAYAIAIPLSIDPDKPGNPFGITSLLEAMAMGKSVIITRSKYIGIDVEKEGLGLTVELGDVEGWRQAVSYLLENPEIAKEMGRRGRQLVEEKFNLDVFSKQLAAHLQSVV